MEKENPAAKVIIFDFDGTIADSFAVAIKIAHQLANRQLEKDDISRLRGMRSREVLRALKIAPWRALFLSTRIRKMMGSHIGEIELVPGMDVALRMLASTHSLYILSANSPENAKAFLEHNHIAEAFSGVYGGVQPWAKGRALRKISREQKLSAGNTWYVGDGYLDIKAAHHAGMKAMAVAWGYSNIHVLESCKPEALVFSSDELTAYFAKDV